MRACNCFVIFTVSSKQFSRFVVPLCKGVVRFLPFPSWEALFKIFPMLKKLTQAWHAIIQKHKKLI